MTKTIWIDWHYRVVCQNEDELWADFEESDCSTDFTTWLNVNFTAEEVWNMDDDMREKAEKDYQEYRREELADYVNTNFQSYEIRV